MGNLLPENLINRRLFIKQSSLSTIALLSTSLFMGGCEDFFKAIANRPVRRRIRNSAKAQEMIDIYRTAVSIMKGQGAGGLAPTDNRFWSKQAQIHQDFCPHGNWFFFPWHRAYLFYFEKICQKLSGRADFGLPYWDWCVDKSIDASFWGNSNALFNPTRIATASSVVNDSSVGLSLVDGYLDEPDFNIFAGGTASTLRPNQPRVYGNIEQTPHNYIHGTFVRGDMGSFMSPLDPIFWSHHCMADLCWHEWNVTRNHANTNDAVWKNFNFTMFYDADGNPTEVSSLMTTIMPLISYRYETDINGLVKIDLTSIRQRNKIDFEATKKIIQDGSQIKFEVKKRFRVDKKIDFDTFKIGSTSFKTDANDFQRVFANDKEERVLLSLKGVNEPESPDLFLRVFINKKDASDKTPVKDPHYAGSFYFFSHGKHSNIEESKVNFVVDITDTVQRLQKSGEMGDLKEMSIEVVAVPIDGRDASNAKVSIESMEIAISPIIINQMKIK